MFSDEKTNRNRNFPAALEMVWPRLWSVELLFRYFNQMFEFSKGGVKLAEFNNL